MRNRYMRRVASSVRRVAQHLKERAVKDELYDALVDLKLADKTYERWIKEARMTGLRNPSFDGDEVGYPDDDFDD